MLRKIFLLLEVLLLIIFLRLVLSFKGIDSILKLVKSPYPLFVGNHSLSRNIKAIQIVSRIVPKCTCLIKAAALKIISAAYQDMSLVIGIQKNQHFQSHAWIEIDNQVIFGETANQRLYKSILAIR
jgi:hypothetical protein